MPKLIVLHGPDAGGTFDVGRTSILGRSAKADVILSDSKVSRWHVQLARKKDGYEVRCFFGSKAVKVNGAPVSDTDRLRHGDTLELGTSILLFSEDDALDLPDTLDEDEMKALVSNTVYRRSHDPVRSTKAFLFDQSRTDGGRLEALLRFERIVGSLDEAPRIHDVILDFIFGTFSTDRATILLREAARERFRVVARRSGMKGAEGDKGLPSRAIVREISNTRDALLVEDASADERFVGRRSVVDQNVRAVMGVPMVFQENLLGVVVVESRSRRSAFSREDLHLLDALGAHASIALERTRLAEAVHEKMLLEKEIQLAGAIQQSLLPETLPHRQDIEVHGVMIPARDVGGDYYDLVEKGDDLLVAVGDVAGKGVNAGLVMMMARTYFRSLSELVDDPGEILSRLNNVLQRDTAANYFMSFLLGRWRPARGSIELCCAGHEVPLIYEAQDREVKPLKAGGLVLGVKQQATEDVTTATVPLEPDDVVLFYSDGVTEAQNEKEEMYGRERLPAVFAKNAGKPLHALVDGIVKDVKAFAGGRPQFDDITVVALKRPH